MKVSLLSIKAYLIKYLPSKRGNALGYGSRISRISSASILSIKEVVLSSNSKPTYDIFGYLKVSLIPWSLSMRGRCSMTCVLVLVLKHPEQFIAWVCRMTTIINYVSTSLILVQTSL